MSIKDETSFFWDATYLYVRIELNKWEKFKHGWYKNKINNALGISKIENNMKNKNNLNDITKS